MSLSVQRNAAIWYQDDGYRPGDHGVNGRRMAGASFLDGFFRHAQVEEFVSLVPGQASETSVSDWATEAGCGDRHRTVLHNRVLEMAPLKTIFYPAPSADFLHWQRYSIDPRAFSVCGIVHTLDSKRVMERWMAARVSPQQEWDAIICTSRAGKAVVERAFELVEDCVGARFGAARIPPRPQLPVIPLGIDTDAFARDQKRRQAFRSRFDWRREDIVVATVARLSPTNKFDPIPLFQALQEAQTRLQATGKRLHYVAYGVYANPYAQAIFEEGARELMPDVSFHHIDGSAEPPQDLLSGADIFAFPIDNLQETFGIAPIEAMAAGLPVIASDWDGLRDTVDETVGIRVPTRTVQADCTGPEMTGHLFGRLSYTNVGDRLSSMVEIDLEALTEAFVTLAGNDALRNRMGKAARERARSHYDWSVVIPQMQDLWEELDAIRERASALPEGEKRVTNPVLPPPGDLFASYPSGVLDDLSERYVATVSAERLEQVWRLRAYGQFGAPFEQLSTVKAIFDAILTTGQDGAGVNEVSGALRMNLKTVQRSWMFLLKHGMIRVAV